MAHRSSTSAIGRRAEDRAAAFVASLGYRVLERNYRCKLGELDIVAEDDGCLVFIEVRSRSSRERGDALDAARPAKMRQVAKVAEHYIARRCPPHRDMRIDVIAITAGAIEHIVDAYLVER